ncbi:MAG: OsmC family protein, partial [Acidimicrobiia bacterium]|nr:OsmC family protein [Acidimicrobiia bacterium]
YALATLGACEAIGYRIWSEKLGVSFDEVRVTVEGDLDLRGPFTNERYPGFQSVRMTVFIRGREPADRYAELERQVEANSPVLALFRDPIPVATEVVFESPA